MRNRPDLPRLYAILDADLAASRGLDPVRLTEIWLAHDIRLIQLRAKTMASGAMLDLARALGDRIRAARGTFIVNDRADIARLAGAAGVHVGQDDLAPAAIRRIVEPDALVGLSTHTPRQVREALGYAPDYVAVGPVFPTTTKGVTGDAPIGLGGVREAAALVLPSGRPLVAIGGITLTTAGDVIAAGATSVAVVTDLLEHDPATRAEAYRAALDLRGA